MDGRPVEIKKCLFSKHIKKNTLGPACQVLEEDLKQYNRIKRRAFALDTPGRNKDPEKSVHIQLKEEFQTDDYFVNSAHQEARAAKKSVLELLELRIKEKNERIERMDKKISSLEKLLKHLGAEKESLIRISKAVKAGRKPPKFQSYPGGLEHQNPDGSFTVGRKRKQTHANAYLFELLYLDPLMKRLRNRLRLISQRRDKTERQRKALEEQKESQRVSVCFGSKKRFHQQKTMEPETWKKHWQAARSRGMTISGRKDAAGGNFVFHYDVKKHELAYRSMNGTFVSLPVIFPYGQEWVDQAVWSNRSRKKDYVPSPKDWDRQAVAWRIEDHGNSFLVKCMVDIPNARKNREYSGGCIGMDMNVDNLGVSETDQNGNLLHHWVVEFGSLRGLTSGQVEQKLSHALEKVFAVCRDTRKPLAVEDLKKVKGEQLYQGKRLNAVLSSFAYRKMTGLVCSKSEKYEIGVWYVNPKFTSQIGKMKYMRRYGLTVHESAAFVIARRAMGYGERMPGFLRDLLPEEVVNRKHHWGHWSRMMKTLKEINWRNAYRKQPEQAVTIKELKEYYKK